MLPCAKQRASGNSLYDAGRSTLSSVTTWRGGMGGREDQPHVYLWLIHVDVWQKPAQYCKAIILQFKIKIFKKTPESTCGAEP